YVLEYGDGYFQENPDARLSRIDYIGNTGNHTPVPAATASATAGRAPLTVRFTSEGTADADGDRLRYAWDFDADGRVDSRRPDGSYTFTQNGLYEATLRGSHQSGRTASGAVRIVVGNGTPLVEFVRRADGDGRRCGDVVELEVRVSDDQPVDGARV